MHRIAKRGTVFAIAGILALAFAGAILASQLGGPSPPDVTALQKAIDAGEMVRVADIPAVDGRARRGVFIEKVSTGQLCLWDLASASSKQRQGGCDPVDDPLGGSAISASLAYDGGPGVANVKDARIIGLAAKNAAAVVIVMNDGSERAVALKPARVGSDELVAFGYRIRRSDLANGIGPIAIVARDASGTELARQPTGIGS